MRLNTFSFFTGAAVLFHRGLSQETTSNADLTVIIQQLSESVPSCAFNCFATEVPQSTCSLTDTTCLCTNTDLTATLASCLAQNCTVIEQLETERYQKTLCGAPVRDERSYIIAVIWPMYAVALLFVVARLVARAPHLSNKAWDDWTIIACLLALTPASVIGHLMVNSGLGRDIWMLDSDQISNVLFYFFIEEYLYTFLVMFTKISMLCLYIRIFTFPKFRLACYILIVVVGAFGISCWISTGFNCTPITFMWQGWDGEHVGTCIDTAKQAFALAGVNMTLDILIFVFPIVPLLKLQMDWKRKVGVSMMFTVGLFVTVCSVIRLHTLMEFGTSTNPTYDYTSLAVWSLIEIDVGVMCACMPGIASLYKRLRPRLFSMGRSGSGPSDGSDPYYRKAGGSGSGKSSNSGGGGGDSYRPGKLGFARMPDTDTSRGYGYGYGDGDDTTYDPKADEAYYHAAGLGGHGHRHQHSGNNIAKTTSVTVAYVDPVAAAPDGRSDEMELVDRPYKHDGFEMNAGGAAVDARVDQRVHPYQPGAETRNYRKNW